MKCLFSLILLLLPLSTSNAQSLIENPWFMYFHTSRFEQSAFGIHAEIQHRNHTVIGDLDQLLIRTGVQYHLADNQATFTLGYGFIKTEKENKPNDPFLENRIYQEAFLRQRISRVRINHRFRFEQRFVENQDFRTRYRYGVFVNVPINDASLKKGTYYVALYNELFTNGQKTPSNTSYFDRNRAYMALGYQLNDNVAVQIGLMNQAVEIRSKNHVQISIHQNLTW